MSDIKQTAIYKSLAKAVRKEDHAELARMLVIVKSHGAICLFNPNARHLIEAFYWDETPQRDPYWRALHDSLVAAGWEDQA